MNETTWTEAVGADGQPVGVWDHLDWRIVRDSENRGRSVVGFRLLRRPEGQNAYKLHSAHPSLEDAIATTAPPTSDVAAPI